MPGAMLERGFWLYVWRVKTPKHEVLYVGRTGDISSCKAAPPYARMGQHLGHVKASNALRTYLEMNGVKPEDCSEYEFIAHGPLFPEQADMEAHRHHAVTGAMSVLTRLLSATPLVSIPVSFMENVNSDHIPFCHLQFCA